MSSVEYDVDKFGECRNCGKLVLRGEMKGANVQVFGPEAFDVERIIRLRLCQGCFRTVVDSLSKVEWTGKLYEGIEIRRSKELSDKCAVIDFDDGQ